MEIQKTGVGAQLPQIKFTKKEEGPKEQVVLGSTSETPDFLKGKPLSEQPAGPGTALGCAAIGGVGGAVVVGGIASIAGAVDAAIGLAANHFLGPAGGIGATAVLGGLAFLKGLKSTKGADGEVKKGSLLNAVVGGATAAGATYLGATMGGTGVLYGAALTGVPAGLIAGVTLAAAGGLVGATAGL
ncbi:MAG TPA: hypothetical protein PL110_08895 [Candidatus Eremiobacteraeota bacterium]|nr:MAG: hypothetical protein BWY64_01590 [bacterium ADurb.Bin363]HPZ08218.1 hypothetical protein [Candidatus Eremiobacteraeota bacterium]